MNKKRSLVLTILVASIVALNGCNNTDSNSDNNSENSVADASSSAVTNETYTIDIDDVDWNVKEEMVDGDRIISLSYTNNTDYPIVDLEIEFTQKEDVTEEQLSVFDDLKERYEWTDEDMTKTYILGYNRKLADPGETVSASPCVVNGTYIYVENMEQYELMEPDNASVVYIGDDNKLYVTYYDFKNSEYGSSTMDSQDAYSWSDSDISSLLPKPELRVVSPTSDKDDYFSFKAYGVSNNDYNSYIEACEEKGFNNDNNKSNIMYSASSDDEYKITIYYNAIEESMTGRIEVAE